MVRFDFFHRGLLTFFLLILAMSVLLTGCFSPPEPVDTVPSTVTETLPPPTTTEPVVTGWVENDGLRFYYDENGEAVTGWQEVDGLTYYFKPTGAMATGEVDIDGAKFHFTSQGQRVILVNPWNFIPTGYEPELVELRDPYGVEGSLADQSCVEDLKAMIDACNRECPEAIVVSSYRTQSHQEKNFARKVKYYLDLGYSQEAAEKEAATIIAVPGTSEHQLGLAFDIIDTRLWALEEEQEDLPAQKWLMEHCWEYGFILRYPKDKIEITGIIYEPWHYRYVGKELAKELHDLGVTLEEYLQNLTK